MKKTPLTPLIKGELKNTPLARQAPLYQRGIEHTQKFPFKEGVANPLGFDGVVREKRLLVRFHTKDHWQLQSGFHLNHENRLKEFFQWHLSAQQVLQ